MMDHDLLISVIIPAYNSETFIERSIRSASRQTMRPSEIIVIDDASTDGTVDVVKALMGEIEELRIIELKTNGGPSRARNVGFKVATGDWLAILDADDAMKPQRLRVLAELAVRTGSSIVADNLSLYDWAADCEVRAGFRTDAGEFFLTPLMLFKSDRFEISGFGFSSIQPMFNREALRRASIEYDENRRYGEDTFLLAKCLFSGMICAITAMPNYVCTTRIGELSRQASPHSRSVPRFDLVIESLAELESAYSDSIDPECRRAIKELKRYQANIHKSNILRQIRKSRQYLRFSAFLFSDPVLVIFLAGRIGRRLNRWVTGKIARPIERPTGLFAVDERAIGETGIGAV